MKKQTLTKLIAVILTLALVAILLSHIEVVDVVDTLTSINPVYLLAGFGLYLLSYFLRALRFHILLNREVGLKDLFNIICIHNMVNNLLPARTGELSYVYLLKKYHSKTAGEGAATLITARLFDMITIVILFFLSTVFVPNPFGIMIEATWVIIFLIFVIILLLLIIIYKGRAFVILLRGMANHFGMDQIHFVDYIFRKMDETIESFCCMRPRQFIWITLLSMGIWFSLYLINYVLVTAMGLNLAFEAVLFASTFALITTILPIQGVGGFGTMEGGWTIGFLAMGLTKEVAISSGFSVHIISIFYLLILGLMGLIAKTKK